MSPPAGGATGTAQALNLALRFVLEVCALAALGFWGWSQTDAPWRYVLILGVPALAAIAWGTFAVSRRPKSIREGARPRVWGRTPRNRARFLGFACWALYDADTKVSSLTLAAVVVIHYAFSYERVRWLLSQPSPA